MDWWWVCELLDVWMYGCMDGGRALIFVGIGKRFGDMVGFPSFPI